MRKTIAFLGDDSWPAWARFRRPMAWLLLILLAAAALRVYGLYDISPPGLEHDEVANWLIDRAILGGKHAVYFQEAYGHEAGFHYLQSVFVGLSGDHALALRLPAAYIGILLVAVHYALTRRLFGATTALISAAFLAFLFWPVFYSRLGLRAISLPFICGLSLYAWWKAWPAPADQHRARWFGLAGFLAGLSLYTYMAARAVPIFFALFALYLLIFHSTAFKQRWRGMALFWLLLILTAAPLVHYLLTNPGAEFRISEIDQPLQAMLAGDLQPVLQNAIKIGGMFALRGDPLWRQNVAGRPVYDAISGLFFYGGLLLALLRLRDERYAFLLIWLGVSVVPSLVTADAPSSIRMINGLLVVTIFPVLVINILARLSPFSAKLSTVLAYLLGLALIGAHIWWTTTDVFHRWPENPEVQFVWQAALTDMAAYLDQSAADSPASIGGWSPDTMDPHTLFLSMRRRDIETRFFGSDSTTAPVSTIIIPESGAGTRLLQPAIRDLSPGIDMQLRDWAGGPEERDTFVLYELPTPALPLDATTVAEIFGGQLELLGYKYGDDLTCCRILSYWRVLEPPVDPRRIFLHALNGSGELVAQHDGLDAPVQSWQAGDLLLHEQLIALPEDAEGFELRLGVYDPSTADRLLLADGRDSYTLSKP